MDCTQNHHIYPQILASSKYQSIIAETMPTVCTSSSPGVAYEYRKDDITSVLHWGQRKLLLTEIEFLSLYGHLSKDVVYAGAAPGTHIAMLIELFPSHRFHLYDPAPFSLDVHENIRIHQELFTDDIASSWEGVLFISDVRSADLDLVGSKETDIRVRADMASQMRWTQLIKPAMASLKFRLPWPCPDEPDEQEYLDGELHFQVWAPPKSTETRLFTNGRSMTVYSALRYESQCFYRNTVDRLARYPHDVKGVKGLDHCGDCMGEIQVLRQYLGAESSNEGVASLMNRITSSIRGKRTLADAVDHDEVKRRTTKRQWVGGQPAYLSARGRKRQV
jgi:cap2 methyltransferase